MDKQHEWTSKLKILPDGLMISELIAGYTVKIYTTEGRVIFSHTVTQTGWQCVVRRLVPGQYKIKIFNKPNPVINLTAEIIG